MRCEASVRPGCAAVDHGGCAELMVSFRTATVCVPLPHQLRTHSPPACTNLPPARLPLPH